jgi:Abortive infection alpha
MGQHIAHEVHPAALPGRNGGVQRGMCAFLQYAIGQMNSRCDAHSNLVGAAQDSNAWLHEQHNRIKDRFRRCTEQITRGRNLEEAIELSPNVAKALIAGAQEETREELMELWARLLANAMDPNLNSVRPLFVDAVKRTDPLDAIVLRYIHENKIATVIAGGPRREGQTIGCDYIGSN